MALVTPFATQFEVDEDTLNAGTIYRKNDGSLWKVLPNGDRQALGSGGSQQITTRVASADILALADTPVEVVPAPGAGLIALPVYVAAATAGGGNAYSVSAISVGPVGVSNSVDCIDQVLSNGTTDAFCATVPEFGSSVDSADWENLPLVISTADAPTDGDYDLILTVQYDVIPVA